MQYSIVAMSLTTAYLTVSNVFGAVAFGVGAIGIVYGMLKCCSRGRRPLYTRQNLEHKVAIVTGANAGIGFETALGLAETNARVILACRDASKGESAAAEVRQRTGNGNVVFRELNLASISSIRHFAARILEEETSLDILVNNAGIIESNGAKTEDGFELMFGVNHLGHFHLTNLLLDRLKESPSARIVVVSSYVQQYRERLNFDMVNEYDVRKIGPMSVTYVQSKLANVLFTQALAKRLEGTKVTVNALHPGFVSTGMVGHMNTPAWRKVSIDQHDTRKG